MIDAKIRIAVAACIVMATSSFAATQPASMPAGDVNPLLPKIPDRTFSLGDFAAKGDGKTLNTDAFHAAIEKINALGGGHLIVAKGIYRTLPFTLCSNLDLHLDEGAVIQARIPLPLMECRSPTPSNHRTK